MKRFVMLLIVGLQFMAFAPMAWAHDDFTEINLTLGIHSTLVKDGAFDFYSGDDWLSSAYFGAEVEVYQGLFVQLGILVSDTRSDLFGEFDSGLKIREPRLAVRYGYTFLEAIRPYALAAFTYAFMGTEIALWGDHKMGYEDGWLDGELGGRLALGCEFFLPRRIFNRSTGMFKDFTFGMALEVGYALTQPFELNRLAHGTNGDFHEDSELPAGYLDLGQLDRSGLFVSYDLRLYF
jgi:hypothetical protein